MPALNLDVLRTALVHHEPFDHMVVPNIISGSFLDAIDAEFPLISGPGSFSLDSLNCGTSLTQLDNELRSSAMTEAMAKKFDFDLHGRPTMVTVRGWCRARDGQIHCDSKDKIITVLIYLNQEWKAEGGRLRLLRSAYDLDDYFVEVPPTAGTMVAFRCTDHSWHGHTIYEGQRRVLQLNWVTDERYLAHERRRHNLSATIKRFKRILRLS